MSKSREPIGGRLKIGIGAVVVWEAGMGGDVKVKGRRDGRCKVSNFWINRCNQPGLASKISPGRPLSSPS